MPIERLLVRALIVLAGIFVVLTLAFYPPQYIISPAIFFALFVITDQMLPTNAQKGNAMKSKMTVSVLWIAVMLCFGGLALLWKLGYLGRFIKW